jgi:serine/threonine protein kinase
LELCESTIGHYLNGEYRGPFPDDLDALYQMSRGLRYIHSHHLVHEDIRPDTVLIAKSATGTLLKLSEFGFESVNRRQHVDYRAPELDRSEATAASDVFSLGCVFMKLAIRGKCEPDERNFLEIIRRKSNFKGELTLI